MTGYAELVPTLPDELTVQIGVLAGPDGNSVVYLSPTWAGSGDPSTWIDQQIETPREHQEAAS